MLGRPWLLILVWRRMSLGTVEVVCVWKVALIAGEKIGTLRDHFWREGELLAVENEHVARFMYVMIALSTLG